VKNSIQSIKLPKVRRFVRKDGYVQLTGNHLNTLEHRFVMEKYIGRGLGKREQVHHINGDRAENKIENHEIHDIAEHSRICHQGRQPIKWVTLKCEQCERDFECR